MAGLSIFAPAHAQSWVPSKAFVQADGSSHTDALVGGVIWPLKLDYSFGHGLLTSYMEASLGRWRSRTEGSESSNAWVSQIGITPVLRYQPDEDSRWFLEAGIGANFIAPIYRSGSKRFSTVFNFGDHLGVGIRFGEKREQELALRVEHFSNGGFEEPNPGENFLELRYSWQIR
jgi:lipid A 3-O-deacylase